MGSFLRHNGIFVFIGFLVVVIGVMGLLIFQRLQVRETAEQPPSQEETEISFTLDQLSPTPSEIPSCTQVTASPSQGAAPLSVSIQTSAIGRPGETLSYIFSFGDEETETVEQQVTSDNGQETQTITHTYRQPGNYTLFVTVEDSSTISRTVCETQVTVTGPSTANPTGTPRPNTPTITSIPTTNPPQTSPQATGGGSTESIARNLTPTRIPTTASSAAATTPATVGGPNTNPTSAQLAQAATLTPTRRPATPTPTRRPSTPTPDPDDVFPTTIDDGTVPVPNVPRAGGFAPTAAAGLGGLAIIALAFISRKVSF